MFPEQDAPHHRPHLHAQYQKAQVALAVDTIEVLAGQLPRRQQRLLEAWSELHQAELLVAWQVAQAGESPPRIEPLR